MQALMIAGEASQQPDLYYRYVKAFTASNIANCVGSAKLSSACRVIISVEKTGAKEIRLSDFSSDLDLNEQLIPFLVQTNISEFLHGKSLAIIDYNAYDKISTLQLTKVISDAQFIQDSLSSNQNSLVITMPDVVSPIDGLIVVFKQKGHARLQCAISLACSNKATEHVYFRIHQKLLSLIDADVEFFRLSFDDISALADTANIFGMSTLDVSNLQLQVVTGITVGEKKISYDPKDYIKMIHNPLIRTFN